MFQLTISVNSANNEVSSAFMEYITGCGITENAVCISSRANDITYLCFGAEQRHKSELISAIKDCLVKVYLLVLKKLYIQKHLRVMHASEISKLLLLNTLVAFDRQTEEGILREEISLSNCFSIDGFYSFRMKELKTRWRDICVLASANSEYLSRDDTVNELLKFLMTAINSKVARAEIRQSGSEFEVTEYTADTRNLIHFDCDKELLLYLIDAAPQTTIISGGIDNKNFRKRINFLFDAVDNYY